MQDRLPSSARSGTRVCSDSGSDESPGAYHRVSEQHLPRYLSEFTGRLNQRDLDTQDQMEAIAGGLVGKRLTYTELCGGKQPS